VRWNACAGFEATVARPGQDHAVLRPRLVVEAELAKTAQRGQIYPRRFPLEVGRKAKSGDDHRPAQTSLA